MRQTQSTTWFWAFNSIYMRMGESITFSPIHTMNDLQIVWMRSHASSQFYTMIHVSSALHPNACPSFTRKFSIITEYIVTRVEEEHLWESKQLGAHSPHVLLSTLMFFNTKHFNLTSVEEHSDLSFSHIMKHWKRGPGQTGHKGHQNLPGQRNVLLRYYPPQSSLSKRKVLFLYSTVCSN